MIAAPPENESPEIGSSSAICWASSFPVYRRFPLPRRFSSAFRFSALPRFRDNCILLHVLAALHKPYGVLSQFTPEPGSRWRTLADFNLPRDVYSLGRLDADSEGLLLLTDEPGLNARLLTPEQQHPREYWAQVERVPSPETLIRLEKGIPLADRITLPCRARLLDRAPTFPERQPPIRYRKNIPDAWLSLELIEGKNRQVRRMTAAVGHPTLRLVRVRIGAFSLGNLAPESWRELTKEEREDVFR